MNFDFYHCNTVYLIKFVYSTVEWSFTYTQRLFPENKNSITCTKIVYWIRLITIVEL